MFAEFEQIVVTTSQAKINLRRGGQGPPLLLLHGYPQTHFMWHKIAPLLAQHFTIIATDLRGYGDSSKPKGYKDHSNYSKRALAQDQVEVMAQLGYEQFYLVAHDRGARVAHRLALDHPQSVQKLALLDIVPTYEMYTTTDREFATAYYHWFFLIQPYDLPEKLIAAHPEYYLHTCLQNWSKRAAAFTPEALAEYQRCFRQPAAIHSSCEDYRASATIDLSHDREDIDIKIACPLLVLWGGLGIIERKYDVLALWRKRALKVVGNYLDCGHFLPEEVPQETYLNLKKFLLNN